MSQNLIKKRKIMNLFKSTRWLLIKTMKYQMNNHPILNKLECFKINKMNLKYIINIKIN